MDLFGAIFNRISGRGATLPEQGMGPARSQSEGAPHREMKRRRRNETAAAVLAERLRWTSTTGRPLGASAALFFGFGG